MPTNKVNAIPLNTPTRSERPLVAKNLPLSPCAYDSGTPEGGCGIEIGRSVSPLTRGL